MGNGREHWRQGLGSLTDLGVGEGFETGFRFRGGLVDGALIGGGVQSSRP